MEATQRVKLVLTSMSIAFALIMLAGKHVLGIVSLLNDCQ